MPNENTPQPYMCEYCEGTGKVYGKECKECKGSGILAKDDKAIYFVAVDEKENLSIADIKEILDPNLKKEYEDYQNNIKQLEAEKRTQKELDQRFQDNEEYLATKDKSSVDSKILTKESQNNSNVVRISILFLAFLILTIATIISLSTNTQLFKMFFIVDILVVGFILLRLFFKDNTKRLFDKLTESLQEPNDLTKYVQDKRKI